MKITLTDAKPDKIKADALVVFLFEGEKPKGEIERLDKAISSSMTEAISLGDFKGKLYEVGSFYTHGKAGAKRILVVGLGKRKTFGEEYYRNVAGAGCKYALKLGVKSMAFVLTEGQSAEDVIEGAGLAAFNPEIYKTKNKKKDSLEEIIIAGKSDLQTIKHSQVVVEAINWVRKIINEPANLMAPKEMVEEAKKIAREHKLDLEILSEVEAAKKGMGAFVGIAKGSEEPSYMVTFKYKPLRVLRPLRGLKVSPLNEVPTLAVVGKGITFDSGGISIKPSEKMHEMKMDMSGAAAVFGFMKIVGQLKPKVNVIGVTPLTENLPGGRALKPGDVVTAYNGKTIEVINTDAEGRVVLADALSYAAKLGATHIVDLATLTGAVLVALGSEAAGILGRPENWVEEVKKAAKEAGERVWELPIYPEHKELLKSDIADLANIPPVRGAGVIAGAVFLREFVPEKLPWAHLDITGTAWLSGEKPFLPKGPTGFGVRTLVKLLGLLEKAK